MWNWDRNVKNLKKMNKSMEDKGNQNSVYHMPDAFMYVKILSPKNITMRLLKSLWYR